ncbi:beta-lactamase/transpeptidase-like protein [Exidia glandulosa HHB12029]|uniref:Beta-lactamase/transpeptidase-like protein n=1 Tax=Exidia glandulosa HHB12029 TaxID=1314781 RepID=A0A165CVH3_EXIGL|nr:beta-lactamase/transpeptidase-like protein [Exidia glandulosa HHB12029]
MTSSLNEQVQKILSDAVNAPNGLPGLVFGAVNTKGETLVTAAAGELTTDSYVALFSVTKFIAGIAAMQLVQRGKLTLDEPIEKVLPEIADIKLLAEDGVTLTKPKNKITLRMLLTHTSGFTYSAGHPALWKYTQARADGKHENSGSKEGLIDQPLVFEPGTSWAYGTSMDWVGAAIMRVSGQTLEEYCAENIFKPLNITEVKWRVTPDIRPRLSAMYLRKPDGTIVERELFPHELPEGPSFQSGGMGSFGSFPTVLRLLGALLAGDPALGLSAATIEEMFTDQLDGKRIKLTGEVLNKPSLSFVPEYTPALPADPSHKGHGLSFMILHDGLPNGRSPGSAMWSGMANCYWSIDRTKGIATLIFAQIIPYFDAAVTGAYFMAEGAVYASLAAST